jgi:hypothetical protein
VTRLKAKLQLMCENEGITQAEMIERLIKWNQQAWNRRNDVTFLILLAMSARLLIV